MATNSQLTMDFSRGRRNAVSQRVHAEKVVPMKARLQDQVLSLIEMFAEKGLTLYELADALKKAPHSISGRISELSFSGKIVSGETRPNAMGNECTIYRKSGLIG